MMRVLLLVVGYEWLFVVVVVVAAGVVAVVITARCYQNQHRFKADHSAANIDMTADFSRPHVCKKIGNRLVYDGAADLVGV